MKNKKKYFFVFLAIILFFSTFFIGANKADAVPAVPVCKSGFHQVGNGCFADNTGLSEKSVDYVLTTFLLWLTGIFGLIAIVAFVFCGIQYLTSAGDEGQAKTAKRNAAYALVGVVIALSGFIIVKAVDIAVRANAANF